MSLIKMLTSFFPYFHTFDTSFKLEIIKKEAI